METEVIAAVDGLALADKVRTLIGRIVIVRVTRVRLSQPDQPEKSLCQCRMPRS